jgi:TatA/E family protein of Tat protein translocase
VFAIFGLLGGSEIILILALILIFFGARKLPELAKGLGQGIKVQFNKQTLVHAITLVLMAALGFTVLACLR